MKWEHAENFSAPFLYMKAATKKDAILRQLKARFD